MPHKLPPSSAVDLVLHIGSGKTGTSSIQYFLHRNRAQLAELGYLYPKTPGRRRHRHLSMSVQPGENLTDAPGWDPERWSSPAEFRKWFRRRLFREINRSGLTHVLLSDEALYGSPDEALRRLRRFTDRIARSLRLVVYLRRQDDHLVSRYQQVVKVGETRRLGDRTAHAGFAQEESSWARRQGAKTYDYYSRLRTWEHLLRPDLLVVRRFERSSFVEGSLHHDFLDATGIQAHADRLEQVEPTNESLDAEAVELLRIVNLLRREDPAAAAMLPNNHSLVVLLAAASTGPTLTMPGAALDQFMARWQESNRRVAVEFLGDDSGELFRTPRKTHNTTTKQYLAPERLDHFLNLLELPEPTHAPLRKLVTREAKAQPPSGLHQRGTLPK